MKWIMREGANTERVACPRLIKKFIDPAAEFQYVPKDRVLKVAHRERGHILRLRGRGLHPSAGKAQVRGAH